MEFRDNRYRTFEGTNQKNSKVKRYWTYEEPKKDLVADCGFYFNPTKTYQDQITCINCKKSETNIENIKDIVSHHLINNPNCQLAAILLHKVNLTNLDLNSYKYWSSQPSIFANPLSKESYELRLRTFKNLKYNKISYNLVSMEALAQAGFYYTPLNESINDRVECLYCQTCLDSWDSHDDPIKEHTKMGPESCYFLRQYRQSPNKDNQSLSNGTARLNGVEHGENESIEESDDEFNDINILNSPTRSQISLKEKKIKKRQIETGNPIWNIRGMKSKLESAASQSLPQVSDGEQLFSDDSSGFSNDYQYSSDSLHDSEQSNAPSPPVSPDKSKGGGSSSSSEQEEELSEQTLGSDEELLVAEESDREYSETDRGSQRKLEDHKPEINEISSNDDLSEILSDAELNGEEVEEIIEVIPKLGEDSDKKDEVKPKSVDPVPPEPQSQSPIKAPKKRGRKRKNELPESQDGPPKRKLRGKEIPQETSEPESKPVPSENIPKRITRSSRKKEEMKAADDSKENEISQTDAPSTDKKTSQTDESFINEEEKSQQESSLSSFEQKVVRRSGRNRQASGENKEPEKMIRSLPKSRQKKITKNEGKKDGADLKQTKVKAKEVLRKNEEMIHQFLNSPGKKSKKVKLTANKEQSPVSILDISNHNLGEYGDLNVEDLESAHGTPVAAESNVEQRQFKKSRAKPARVQRIESSNESKEILRVLNDKSTQNSVLKDNSPPQQVEIEESPEPLQKSEIHNDEDDEVLFEDMGDIPVIHSPEKTEKKLSPVKNSLPSDISVSTDIDVGKYSEVAKQTDPFKLPSSRKASLDPSPKKTAETNHRLSEESLNSSQVNDQYRDEINYLMGLNNKLAKSMLAYNEEESDSGEDSEEDKKEVPFNQQHTDILDAVDQDNPKENMDVLEAEGMDEFLDGEMEHGTLDDIDPQENGHISKEISEQPNKTSDLSPEEKRKDRSTINDSEVSPFKDYVPQNLKRLSKEPLPLGSRQMDSSMDQAQKFTSGSLDRSKSPGPVSEPVPESESDGSFDDEYSKYEKDGSFIIGVAPAKTQSPHKKSSIVVTDEIKTNDNENVNNRDDENDSDNDNNYDRNENANQANDVEVHQVEHLPSSVNSLWQKSAFEEISNKLSTIESACEYLGTISKTSYNLKDDLDGELTQFIANMPEEEEDMTIKQWIEHNSINCQKVVREICNEMIENFKYERDKALQVLEALPVADE